jgi:hypothetical protein
MFFYVDESGHTGTNLFDPNQPILYYGVLSSRSSLDALAVGEMKRARHRLGVDRLHASQLGLGGLVEITSDLIAIDKRFRPKFDLYRIVKRDHAIISFFDQVFDQGVNPAVTWTGYWTPLRFILLLKVASLFDDDLAKRAWQARIEINNTLAETELVGVCREILLRVPNLADERSKQLIGDALNWATKNPAQLHYNCTSKKDVLTVTPNLIGFQSVMHAIAAHAKHARRIVSITIDQQTQFNKAQRTLAEFYAANKRPWVLGIGLPTMDLSHIPDVPLSFRSGEQSIGLELVDVYLWIFKRFTEGKGLAQELLPFVRRQLPRVTTGDISLRSLEEKWSKWFAQLPEPTEEQMAAGRELLAIDETRRVRAVVPNE